NQIDATIPGAGGYFAVGDGSVWTSGSNDKQGRTSELSRIDPSTNQIVRTIPLDMPAPYITFGEGAVWGVVPTLLPNSTVGSGDLIRIDPSTNEVAATIHVSASPGALAVGDGLVWVWGSVSVTLIDLHSVRCHAGQRHRAPLPRAPLVEPRRRWRECRSLFSPEGSACRRKRFRAPGSVWFQDIVDGCLRTSFTPLTGGCGDV